MAIHTYNNSPYFDNYNEEQDFLQILFTPSRAVQTKELTQIQTILQTQLERFANHIFETGTPIAGGQVNVNTNIVVYEVGTGEGDNFSVGDILTEVGATTKESLIVHIVQDKIYCTTVKEEFAAADVLTNGTNTATIIAEAPNELPKSNGSLASIDNGVFYLEGRFVKCEEQTIPLSDTTNAPTVPIGLAITRRLITENDVDFGTILLDNAAGTANQNAPGAHRYMLDVKLSIDSNDGDYYVKLFDLTAGAIDSYETDRFYNELGKQLAHRTYEESGNYTLRPFTLSLQPFTGTDDEANAIIEGKTAADYLTARVSDGQAYIRGYERDLVGSISVSVERARDSQTITDERVSTNIGSYVICTNGGGAAAGVSNKGPLSFLDQAEVELHNVARGSISGDTTQIGTARVLYVRRVIGSGANAAAKFRVYLRNEKYEDGHNRGEIRSIVELNVGRNGVDFGFDVDSDSIVDDVTTFTGPPRTNLLFPLTQNLIESFADDTIAANQIEYVHVKSIGPATFNDGRVTNITSINNLYPKITGQLDASTLANIYGMVIDAGTSGRTVGDIVTFASGRYDDTDSEIDELDTGEVGDDNLQLHLFGLFQERLRARGKTYAGITAREDITAENAETNWYGSAVSTSTTNGILYIPTLAGSQTTNTISLNTSDVYKIRKIVDLGKINAALQANNPSNSQLNTHFTAAALADADNDITNDFIFDNGQRDNLYDHATLTRKSNAPAPEGPIVIYFSYFDSETISMTQGAFFNRSSYPSAIRYDEIPKFQSSETGTEIRLADVLDFRPVRTNGAGNTGFNGLASSDTQNIKTPDPIFGADIPSYNYYIPRKDRIILEPNGSISTVKGNPSLNPTLPQTTPTSMTLFELDIPAYTFSPEDVNVQNIDHRRYTMKDIADLERRIIELEVEGTESRRNIQAINALEEETDTSVSRKNARHVNIDHLFGDTDSVDYNASIDILNEHLRPPFDVSLINFADTSAGSGASSNNNITTLDYNTTSYLANTTGDLGVSINSHSVGDYNGFINLSHDNDILYDAEKAPAIKVPELAAYSERGINIEFQNWITRWVGVDSEDTNTIRIGTGKRSIRKNSFDKTRHIDAAVVPYIRSQTIDFTAYGMRPSATVYAFVDGERVYDDSTGTRTAEWTVGASGSVTGKITITNSQESGTKIVRLIDSDTNTLSEATTKAQAPFYATGLPLRSPEGFIKPLIRQTLYVNSSNPVSDILNDSVALAAAGKWQRPLAQQFTVIEESGVFLTTADLYFNELTEVPDEGITVSIRPVENGEAHPSKIVDGTQVWARPAVSTEELSFNFRYPVYLPKGDYAIVVETKSPMYKVKVSEVSDTSPRFGPFSVVNNNRYSSRTDLRMKFELHRANFDTSANAELTWTGDSTGATDTFNYASILADTIAFSNTSISWNDASASGWNLSNPIPNTTQKVSATAGNKTLITTLSSRDSWLSPVLYNDRISALTVKDDVGGLSLANTDFRVTGAGSGYVAGDDFRFSGEGWRLIGDITVSGDELTGLTITSQTFNNVGFLEDATDFDIDSTAGTGGAVEFTASEQLESGGFATAKYITNQLTSNSASNLTVILESPSLKSDTYAVYAKVLNSDDENETFDSVRWQLLDRTRRTFIDESTLRTTWELNNIEYVSTDLSGNTTTYTEFQRYVLKIVMLGNSGEDAVISEIFVGTS